MVRKIARDVAVPFTFAVAVGAALIASVAPAFAAFDYANTFAPVSTDLQAALVAVVPIALGVFVIVLAIRLGSRLIRNFVR